MSAQRRLVLGVDGGGTATRAVLADRDGAVLGRGAAGPGNPKSAGLDAALAEVNLAIQGAFSATGLPIQKVDAVCLALAGAGRLEDRPPIEAWVQTNGIAARTAIVPDAVAVLAAGNPDVVGVSLIAGTGSMAFGRNEAGDECRSGGWGHLFGDEGSGYALAIAGLRAAVRAVDGRGPATALLPAFLDHLRLSHAGGLVTTLYSPGWDKRRIANLARVVTACAEIDDVARGQLEVAAQELTTAAMAVVHRLSWNSPPMVALTGGLVVNAPAFRALLEHSLRATSRVSTCNLVEEPALGAIRVATRLAAGVAWS